MHSTYFLTLLLALSGELLAQVAEPPLGQWASTQQDIFVSPNGNDLLPGTSAELAVQTIQQAVTNAELLMGTGPGTSARGVTINVMPGTYVTGEITLPAYGLCIEPFWSTQPLPVIQASGLSLGQGLLHINRSIPAGAPPSVTAANLPPTVIRGLKLDGHNGPAPGLGSGIIIDFGSLVRPHPRVAVRIYECTIVGFHENGIVQHLGSFGQDMVDATEIVDNDISDIGQDGIILFPQVPFSAVLIKRNRIHDIGSEGIWVDGGFIQRTTTSGSKGECRIISNAISHCASAGIALTKCSARILSNTIAFCGPQPGNITPGSIVYRAESSNGGSPLESLVIANNILFSPGVPEVDLAMTAFPGNTAFSGFLVFENNACEADSGLVDVMLLPLSRSRSSSNVSYPQGAPPPFAGFPPSTTDLHCMTPTPGNYNDFAKPGQPNTIMLSPSGILFPCDVNQDMDGDAMIHQNPQTGALGIQVGADQQTDCRLSYATSGVSPEAVADRVGNLRPFQGLNAGLLLRAPKNSVAFLLLGTGFANGATYQHVVHPIAGSLLVDPTTSATLFMGTVPLTGELTTTLPLQAALKESEVYLQGMFIRSNNAIGVTNRLRIDVENFLSVD